MTRIHLVLLDVVLQAQGVARIDVDELAEVAIGDRPAQLVPPGLVDPARARGVDGPDLRGSLAHSLAPTATADLETPLCCSSAVINSSTR